MCLGGGGGGEEVYTIFSDEFMTKSIYFMIIFI